MNSLYQFDVLFIWTLDVIPVENILTDYVNLERRTNPDIQSSEILFAWIQECGWNKESYQPQFNQHSTTIEPPFTTMATIEPFLTIKTWTLKR